MRAAPWVKETRREFINEKRRGIRGIRRIIKTNLQMGCALKDAFDGTLDFSNCVHKLEKLLKKMDEITKKH
jgi:hypothetical protein